MRVQVYGGLCNRQRADAGEGHVTATLEITTVAACPVRCSYCPQDALKDAYEGPKWMTFDTFMKALRKIPREVRIDFSGMVEPWTNPHCTIMLLAAINAGRHVAIYTTLAGMTPDQSHWTLMSMRARPELFDVVCLHLPDANGHMRGLKVTPEYLHTVRDWLSFRDQGVLRRFEIMTMDVDGRFDPRLGLPASLPWEPIDRAGNLDVDLVPIRPKEHRHFGPIRCAVAPNYDHNVLLPNGDVVLCCMDYSLKHRLGSLLEDSWATLHGAPLDALRASNAAQDGETLCRTCNNAEPKP